MEHKDRMNWWRSLPLPKKWGIGFAVIAGTFFLFTVTFAEGIYNSLGISENYRVVFLIAFVTAEIIVAYVIGYILGIIVEKSKGKTNNSR